jgi:hypothetical protein
MFSFKGNDLVFANLTIGNYCNVDLDFPLKSSLSRPKRSSTVVQAQLAFVEGDRIEAHNCHFLSRLNTCNLSGGKRTLFDRCHVECTDDALATGVYLNCTFGFYSSKPFGGTRGTGSVMLNCDFDVRQGERQYFTKVQGQVAVVNSRYHSKNQNIYIGWNQNPTDNFRGYQSNVTLNGQPIIINADKPEITVDMTGKRILDAYCFEYQGKIYYNTYNLLCGDDDWDPMGIKEIVRAAEKERVISLTGIATQMLFQPAVASTETSVSDAKLQVIYNRFGNFPDKTARNAEYKALGEEKNYYYLDVKKNVATVSGRNFSNDAKRLILQASIHEGLEAAAVVDVLPKTKAAPEFITLPTIKENSADKSLNVNYQIELLSQSDNSIITWYRFKDKTASDTIAVKVSRNGNPELQYPLTQNDVGYYIAVKVEPRHKNSLTGESKFAFTNKTITARQVKTQNISTDFHDFPILPQDKILAGFWTLDVYSPVDNTDYEWNKNRRNTANSWIYGKGADGAAAISGLIPLVKGSRLLFTPVEKKYDDMRIYLQANPCKTAAQGFGMAGQYLDIFIKFDNQTMSGYALRIIRTTKSARAVDFLIIKYENGQVTPVTEPVTTTAFLTACKINIEVQKDILRVHAETTANKEGDDYPNTVNIQTIISHNTFGGAGLFFTSSGGTNSTVFDKMEIEWGK